MQLYTAFACVCLFSLGLTQDLRPSNDVSVWIDPVQARALSCRGATLDIIRDGQPQPIIEKILNKLTSVPSDVTKVNITWRASPGFTYSIHTRSANSVVMTDPAFNIPLTGKIPTSDTVFQIRLPCTGRRTGTVSVRLTLKIWDATNRHVAVSPLRMRFQKQCEKKVIACHPPCSNNAVCADDGVCECPDGYYGTSCKHAICIPHCLNGGTCISPNECLCAEGFSGNFCQTAWCEDGCSTHGQCVAPNTCICQQGWTGTSCSIRLPQNVKSRHRLE